jgi:hypothetical protein
MPTHTDNPFVVFAFALIAQGFAAFAGDFLRRHSQQFRQGERHDFATIQAATLTLLALIIGFTFSMATLQPAQDTGGSGGQRHRHRISAYRSPAGRPRRAHARAVAEISRPARRIL